MVKYFFMFWFKKIRHSFIMPSARVISFDKLIKTEGHVLLDALKKNGRDYIEVVFHPATVADYCFFGNISTKRVKEYEFVSSKSVYDEYVSNGFEFVNYGDIS